MRPISVLPILSRLTERLLTNNYIIPAMLTSIDLSNQFAYLPTRSTSAALITIFSKVTSLLVSNDSVFVITFDYSKAFDTISHSSVASVLTTLPIPYNLHNWIIDYLSGRSQFTLFQQSISDTRSITAGIVQGSVLGPILFNMVSSTQKPISNLTVISNMPTMATSVYRAVMHHL